MEWEIARFLPLPPPMLPLPRALVSMAGDDGLGLTPSPFPFLPIPKRLFARLQGLATWKVTALHEPNVMEDHGQVYAKTRSEALEAAENTLRNEEDVLAVQVYRA